LLCEIEEKCKQFVINKRAHLYRDVSVAQDIECMCAQRYKYRRHILNAVCWVAVTYVHVVMLVIGFSGLSDVALDSLDLKRSVW